MLLLKVVKRATSALQLATRFRATSCICYPYYRTFTRQCFHGGHFGRVWQRIISVLQHGCHADDIEASRLVINFIKKLFYWFFLHKFFRHFDFSIFSAFSLTVFLMMVLILDQKYTRLIKIWKLCLNLKPSFSYYDARRSTTKKIDTCACAYVCVRSYVVVKTKSLLARLCLY